MHITCSAPMKIMYMVVCIKNMTCIWHLQLYPRHHTTAKLRTLCSLACTCMLQTYLCHGHQASLRLTIMACTEMCSRTEQEVECGELLYPFWYPQDMKVFSLLVSSLKSRLWGRVGCVCTLLFHAALVPFTISGLNSYRALPLLFILHAIKSGGGQELSLFIYCKESIASFAGFPRFIFGLCSQYMCNTRERKTGF